MEKFNEFVDKPFGKIVALALSIIPYFLYALLLLIARHCLPVNEALLELLPAILVGVIGFVYYEIRIFLSKRWKNAEFLSKNLFYLGITIGFAIAVVILFCYGLVQDGMNVLAVLISSFFGLYGPSEETRHFLQS